MSKQMLELLKDLIAAERAYVNQRMIFERTQKTTDWPQSHLREVEVSPATRHARKTVYALERLGLAENAGGNQWVLAGYKPPDT